MREVRYWDSRNVTHWPRAWDHGDWHHAVLGVELRTDAGPFTVTWTDTFFPYGVEVFAEPIERHLVLGPDGPEGWDVTPNPRWIPLLNQRIAGVRSSWERLEFGPAVRIDDGVEVAPSSSVELPVGLRIDVSASSVWFIAACAEWPDAGSVNVPGDEIVVAFTADKVRRMGFADDSFTKPKADRHSTTLPTSRR